MSDIDSNSRRYNLPSDEYYKTIERIRRNEGRCIECGEKIISSDYCEKCQKQN